MYKFIYIILLIFMLLCIYNEIQLKYILYIICIVLFLPVLQTNSIEGMTDLEAVSNVASLYNNKNMTVDNLNVTGKLTVNGLSKLSGIDNHNGIRTNDLTVINVKKNQNQSHILISPNWIDFIDDGPGNTTKQQWTMYNSNGHMRFWAKGISKVLDLDPQKQSLAL
jgi:hypothetical protein